MAYHAVVGMEVGDLQVDIDTIHPLMVVGEEVVAGLWIEDLMGLGLGLGHSKAKGYPEIMLTYVQGKEIGSAQIPRKSTIFFFFIHSFMFVWLCNVISICIFLN